MPQAQLEELIRKAGLRDEHAAAFRHLFAQVLIHAGWEAPEPEPEPEDEPLVMDSLPSGSGLDTATFSLTAAPPESNTDSVRLTDDETGEETLGTGTSLGTEEVEPGQEEESEEPADLGRYEDLGMLAQGGMGLVRRVLDPELNRSLAMKILSAKRDAKEDERSRFVEEAQIGAQLQHPNIVPVHELGLLPDGRPYFTMREVRGRRFSDVIRAHHKGERDAWTLRRLIDAYLKVCEAIAFAHDKGVIHRDLKPSNVMTGRFGEVLVVDWGIAKILSGEGAPDPEESIYTERSQGGGSSTMWGQITGTPSYMSPELAKEEGYGKPSDTWAVGVLLFELLALVRPFDGTSLLNTITLRPHRNAA